MARVKRSTALTLIFIVFLVVLVVAATIAYFYAKKNDVGRVNITLVYGTYSDLDGFEKEEASQNTIHTTVKSVRIGTIANLNFHDFDRMGHGIEGWYLDKDFENKFLSGTTIKEDLVLYAKWEIQSYTIRFFSSPDESVNNTNYLEYSASYVYNTDVQVKDLNGNYVNGFINPFNGVNGKYDYVTKPYHEFTGWKAKFVIAGEVDYDDSYYNVNSFKMPAQDLSFVVNWEKFQAKILLKDGVLDGTNSELKPVTNGYYVKNESSLLFNEEDIISASTLENGFKLTDIKMKIDYNNQEQAMTYERYGWITNSEDEGVYGYHETNYQVNLSDGYLVEEKDENGNIIDRYYQIELNANWQKEKVTLNFYTGDGNKVVYQEVDSYSIVDISEAYNKQKNGAKIIGWAIPNKLTVDTTKLQYKDYLGYSGNDVNYFIGSNDYKIITTSGEIEISETNANDSKIFKTSGRKWAEDFKTSDVSALTIHLFAIWGQGVIYNNTASTQSITTYIPTQVSGNQFTAEAQLLGNHVFTKEKSTLLGWSENKDGSNLYETLTVTDSGKLGKSAKLLYSVWLNGDGSEEAPFQISSMSEWNNVFQYLNEADRYYTDDYGNHIYITEKITLNERYPEVSGNKTYDYVLINENCNIVQTKTFNITNEIKRNSGIFAGNYDGQNFQIKIDYNNVMLFNLLGVDLGVGNEERIAKIQNLNISVINGKTNTSSVLGYYSYNAEITNCTFNINVSKEPITGSSIRGIGGVFQRAYAKTTFKNCLLSGNMNIKLAGNSVDKSIGGYVGYGQANFINCVSSANINVSETVSVYGSNIKVGQFIGTTHHDNLETLVSTIENCETLVSTINVTLSNGHYSVGGFVGHGNVVMKGVNTNNTKINSNYSISTQWREDNANKAIVEATPNSYIRLGGFVGYARSFETQNSIVETDKNTEAIVSPKLVNNGQIVTNSKALETNSQSRQINRSQTYIGGIVGQMILTKDLSMNNLINTANITSNATTSHNEDTSTTHVGGLLGCVSGNSYDLNIDGKTYTIYYKLTLSNVENAGTISSTDVKIFQGGIIGHANLKENYSKLTLNNVKNNGEQIINSLGGNSSLIKVGGIIGSVVTSVYIGYDNAIINKNYSSINKGNITLTSANNRTTGNVQVGGAIGCMTDGDYSSGSITSDLFMNNFTNEGNILEELNHKDKTIIIGGIVGASGTIQLTQSVNNGQIQLKNKANKNYKLNINVGGIVGIVSDNADNTSNSLRIKSNNIKEIIDLMFENHSTFNLSLIDLIDTNEMILSFNKTNDDTYPNSLINFIKEKSIDCQIQYEREIASVIDDVKNAASISIDADTYYWGLTGIAGIVGYHKKGKLEITNTINDRVGILNSDENISIISNMSYIYQVQNPLNVGGIVGLVEAGIVKNNDGKTEPALQIKSNDKENKNVINFQKILISLNHDDVNLSIGGIVGYATDNISIDYAKNLGKIRTEILNAKSTTSIVSSGIGGIIGKVSTDSFSNVITISNCINGNKLEDQTIIELNKIKTTNSNAVLSVGGILGYSSNTCTMNIVDCVNYNKIETKNEVKCGLKIGGIVGFMAHGKISASETNYTTTNSGEIILDTTSTVNNNNVIHVGGIVGYTNHVILDNVSSVDVIVGSPTFYNTHENYIGGLIGYLYTSELDIVTLWKPHEILEELATGNYIKNCITGPVQFIGEANCYVGGAVGYAYGEVKSTETLNLVIKNTTSPTNKSISVNLNNTTNTDITNNMVCVGGMIGRLDKMIQTFIGDESNVNSLVQNNMAITVNTTYENKNTTYVGGMIGYAFNTRYSYLNNGLYLNNCVNKGNISVAGDNSSIGGMIGYTIDANIVNCKTTSTIKDYTSNKISTISRMGGLVGYSIGKLEIYLSRVDGGSLATNNISTLADNAMVGGIVGRVDGSAIIEDCFVRIAKFDIPKNINANDDSTILRSSISLGGFVGLYNNRTFNQLEIYHSYVKTGLNKTTSNNVLIGGVVGKLKDLENLTVTGNNTYNFYDLQFSSSLTNVDIGNVSGFSDFDKDSNAISVKNSNIWSGSDISIKELEEPLMISYKKPGNNTDNIVVNNPRTYVMIDQLCASYNSGSGKIQEFLGWSEKENGGVEDIKYHFGDMVYVAKNITLYPVFEEISNNNAKNAPGTSSNPYVINNINDWNMILVSNAYTNTTNNNYVTYFQLGDDITLDNTAIVVTKFNGVLDGNNHKITLNNSKIPFIEINGTIRNLNVVSNSVQTYTYNDTTFASCLAVYLNGGIIENVKVSGRLQTSAQVIGSIVAHAYSGYINNSTSSVEMELVNIDSNKTTFGGLVGTSGYIRNNSGENKGEIFDIVEGSPMFGNGTYLTSATASKGIKFALVIDHSYFIDGRELQENDPNRGLTIRYLNATDGVVTDGGNVPSIQGGLLGSSTQHVLIKNINTSNNFVKFYRNGGSTGGLMGMNREGVTRFKDCNYNNTDINVEGGSYYGNYLGHGNQGSTFNEFINCVNSANIRSSTSNFGGIVGKGSCVYFESVINYGTISTNVKTTNVGGLIGYIIDGGFYIKDSTWDTSSNPTNNEISAERFGGLVGRFNGGSTNSSYNKTESYWYRSGITNSNVNATIIGSVTSFGGFVGYIDSSSGTTIDSCNESIVVFNGSANVIGGLIGQTTSATIKNSSTQSNFTNVTLTGSNPAFGGLIGKSAGTVSISECNVLAGNNTISLKADNPLYVGGFVGYTSGAVSSITISGSKFNTPLTLDIPVTSYIGGAVGYTNRTDITVEESTIIELQTYTVSNSALVTEYYGGVVAYFYNKDNTIGNSDWLKVKNSTIAIKNTIDSSNGKRGLIAGYVEVPTYVVETKDDKTGQINRTTYYRYTISGNTIYYTGNARIMGNVSSLAEHSTYYTNNTQSDYQSV